MPRPAPKVKLCVNCKFYFGQFCKRPLNEEKSLVSGKHINRLKVWAESERKDGVTLWKRRERCGTAGKFYESNVSTIPTTGGTSVTPPHRG